METLKVNKIAPIFGTFIFASLVLTSCGGFSTDKKEETKTLDSMNGSADSLLWTHNNKAESEVITAIASNKVTCTEKETNNEDEGDPSITKTCLYKTYKTISVGTPDYKGRYSWEHSVFKKQENGSYVQIENALMFKENKNELLSIINSKIEKDYIESSNYPDAKDCFEGFSFTPFNYDQIGISFNDNNEIQFTVVFGLCDACRCYDLSFVSFNLDEIQEYLSD